MVEKLLVMDRCSGRPSLLPLSGLILAMLIWGGSFIAMKVALSACHPLVVIFLRMSLASAFFLIFRKRFGKIRYRKGDWKLLGLMALFEPCLYFIFESYALVFTSASEAGMITGLLPILTALAARVTLSERISYQSMAGLIIALVGVVILSSAGKPTESAPRPLLGNLLEFAAMVCATGFTVISRRLSVRYSAFFLTAVQAFTGSAFFMPALFLPSVDMPSQWPWHVSLSMLYLGVLVSVLAYFLYNYGLSRIPACQVTPYVNLIPVFSMFLGWLVLGERLTTAQYFASVLVVAGTFISRHGSFEPAEAPSEAEVAAPIRP